MEARRISASPRPCSGRRVVARKRPRHEAAVNSVRKLQRREISSSRDRAFSMSAAQERFRNIQLQEEFDTHDPKENSLLLPYLRKSPGIMLLIYTRTSSSVPLKILSIEDAGSINISNILTGKCLAKIKASDLCKQKKAWKFQSTALEALEDITALYYDEERDEIYTGNRQGLVHVVPATKRSVLRSI
uniref:Uncharacterized protein n=1 Tax=Oryza meridionalis TaxID=40149 RepID=A0A0E0DT52_9ORYZ